VDEPQHAAYLSHSWSPDQVDPNRQVWDVIWAGVRTVVDAAEGAVPPYYVNRIESALRRSDLFLAILGAAQDASPGSSASPYQLFEMDLATRADLPRFAVYDERLALPLEALRSAGFELAPLGPAGSGLEVLRSWLERVISAPPPATLPLHRRIGVLVDDDPWFADLRAAAAVVAAALGLELVDITPELTDADIVTRMRRVDVLVVDLAARSSWATYGVAHGLMIPAIRLFHGAAAPSLSDLPAILQGHEAGYLLDVVTWSEQGALVRDLQPRVACLYAPVEILDDRESGRAYFERYR
jgi:hypothetical protein